MSARILALLVLMACPFSAQAVAYADQGLAYEGCWAQMNQRIAAANAANPKTEARAGPLTCGELRMNSGTGALYGYAGRYQYRPSLGAGQYGAHQYTYIADHTFPTANTCAARPASNGGWFSSAGGGYCHGGCAMGPATSSDSLSVNGRTYYSGAGATPTGAVCTYGEGDGPMTNDQCSKVGDLTQCVTKEGKHCAVASTGKKFCWNPNEAGTKVSGNEAATKAPAVPGVDIKEPPVPPKNNGDWQQSGSGTATVTSGGNSTTYNVTNYTSNYGTEGSGGGAEGEGDGDGEGEGSGTVGPGLGDLYTPTDKTVSSIFAAFKTRVGESPLIGGINAFFTVNVSGSCPVFTVPASAYWDTLTFSAHCEGDFLAALQAIGWVLLAMACLFAAWIALS